MYNDVTDFNTSIYWILEDNLHSAFSFVKHALPRATKINTLLCKMETKSTWTFNSFFGVVLSCVKIVYKRLCPLTWIWIISVLKLIMQAEELGMTYYTTRYEVWVIFMRSFSNKNYLTDRCFMNSAHLLYLSRTVLRFILERWIFLPPITLGVLWFILFRTANKTWTHWTTI